MGERRNDMKLQIKFTIKDDQTQEELKRSKTFSNVNDLENDALIEFSQAYMSLTNIKKYQVLKITSDLIENVGE